MNFQRSTRSIALASALTCSSTPMGPLLYFKFGMDQDFQHPDTFKNTLYRLSIIFFGSNDTAFMAIKNNDHEREVSVVFLQDSPTPDHFILLDTDRVKTLFNRVLWILPGCTANIIAQRNNHESCSGQLKLISAYGHVPTTNSLINFPSRRLYMIQVRTLSPMTYNTNSLGRSLSNASSPSNNSLNGNSNNVSNRTSRNIFDGIFNTRNSSNGSSILGNASTSNANSVFGNASNSNRNSIPGNVSNSNRNSIYGNITNFNGISIPGNVSSSNGSSYPGNGSSNGSSFPGNGSNSKGKFVPGNASNSNGNSMRGNASSSSEPFFLGNSGTSNRNFNNALNGTSFRKNVSDSSNTTSHSRTTSNGSIHATRHLPTHSVPITEHQHFYISTSLPSESMLSASPPSMNSWDHSLSTSILRSSSLGGGDATSSSPPNGSSPAYVFQEHVQQLSAESSQKQLELLINMFPKLQITLEKCLESIQLLEYNNEQRFVHHARFIQDGGIPNYIAMKFDTSLYPRRVIADIYKFTFACDGFGINSAPHVERDDLIDYTFINNGKMTVKLAPLISILAVATSATMSHFSNAVTTQNYDMVKKELKNVSNLSPILIEALEEAKQRREMTNRPNSAGTMTSMEKEDRAMNNTSPRRNVGSFWSMKGNPPQKTSSGIIEAATYAVSVGVPGIIDTSLPRTTSPTSPKSPILSPVLSSSEWISPKFIDAHERIQIREFYQHVKDRANRGDYKGALAGLNTVSTREWQRLGGNKYTKRRTFSNNNNEEEEIEDLEDIKDNDRYEFIQVNEPKGEGPASRSLCHGCYNQFRYAQSQASIRRLQQSLSNVRPMDGNVNPLEIWRMTPSRPHEYEESDEDLT